jgi:VIT1/CCC1 family predicted Fe2+/Mn2+ transporter
MRALVDGSPILASTVLPATVLVFGRLDLLTDNTARIAAVLVAVLQLFAIGAFVARVAPAPPAARWTFAATTAGIGMAVVALTVLLGH